MKMCANAFPGKMINLSPQQFGLSQIGHMGYFRQGAEQIWDQVAATFDLYLPSDANTSSISESLSGQ